MIIPFIIALTIGLILILSGSWIRKDPSVLAGSKEGSELITPKAFYVAGLLTILCGVILLPFGNPLSLMVLSIIAVPVLLVYINIKLIRHKSRKLSNIVVIVLSILFSLSMILFLC
jgi:hypothetical protein